MRISSKQGTNRVQKKAEIIRPPFASTKQLNTQTNNKLFDNINVK
jgi:hypothetical protein